MYELLIMPGEGIGLEIIPQAMRVIEKINNKFNIEVLCTNYEIGELCYKKHGYHLPPEAARHCKQLMEKDNAAILFGAVSDEPIGLIRKNYDLFANIRPIKIMKSLKSKCRLNINNFHDIDICIVRELTSGIYYGREMTGVNAQCIRYASQEMYYDELEIERITYIAFKLALMRKNKVTLVHKSNSIKNVFNLWLYVCNKISKKFPLVQFNDIYVDNMAMQMILNPTQFDVVLCANLFGDILSDLGAGIVGSIGVLASISQNEKGFSLYEGIGGTAPDICGHRKANPISAILSVALFYQHTVRMPHIANFIEKAINEALKKFRTEDISDINCHTVTTSQMTDQILYQLDSLL